MDVTELDILDWSMVVVAEGGSSGVAAEGPSCISAREATEDPRANGGMGELLDDTGSESVLDIWSWEIDAEVLLEWLTSASERAFKRGVDGGMLEESGTGTSAGEACLEEPGALREGK